MLRRTGDFVTLREELQLVDAYLAIEQTRFEERLRIEREMPEELGDLLVPPLILQPIVENAVKHGISPLRRGGTISIRARVEIDSSVDSGERLCLSVHDTGKGVNMNRSSRDRARGVGLANVENRLLRYYGPAGSLRITSSTDGGTLVELSLPATRRLAAVGAT